MVNYEWWIIGYSGLGVRYWKLRIEVFCCALTSGQAPLFGRPPAHPSCGELDGLFFGWGLAQRLVYSLNKFRANPSPIPKYSLQIIHFIVLLFQIVNLWRIYSLETQGLLRHVCLHVRRTGKRLRAKDHAIAWGWSVFLFFILVGQVQLPYVAMTKTRRANPTNN